MFLPIYDYNRLRYIKHPYVTWALIATNVFIYAVFQSGLLLNAEAVTNLLFGFMPASILPGSGAPIDVPAAFNYIPPTAKLFTYMFLHGGWWHLIGNMAFLWVFGDNIEDAMGHLRYFLFYIVCGVAGGLAHFWAQASSDVPLIGASGAVSGLIAAYLILYPRAKVWIIVLLRIPLKLRAVWVLGFWVLLNVAMVLTRTMDDTAWWAHIGGLAAGAVLVLIMRREGVGLFAKDMETVGQVADAAGAPPVTPVSAGATTTPVAPIDAPTVVVRVDRPKSDP